MKSLVVLSVCLLISVDPAEAEDSAPKSSPTPGPTSSEMEPALPAPDATPVDAGPTLLPGSDELPTVPRTEQPASTSINRASTEAPPREGARFAEVRSLAMNNPRAAYLLKRARNSTSARARRTYLRAYYETVAARMRKLDPELKSSIDGYEEAEVRQVAGSANSSNGPSHRSHSHRTAGRESHHRSRRVAAHHRYQRMMIIYDPYGPYMPPYGPPMVFDPW
jgi:hypothetical protein